MLNHTDFSLEYFVGATRASPKTIFCLYYLSGEARLAPTDGLRNYNKKSFPFRSVLKKKHL
jgi:hypothetical protein